MITLRQVYDLARSNGQFAYALLGYPQDACQKAFNDQLSNSDLARVQKINCEMYQIYGEKLFVAAHGSTHVNFTPPTSGQAPV